MTKKNIETIASKTQQLSFPLAAILAKTLQITGHLEFDANIGQRVFEGEDNRYRVKIDNRNSSGTPTLLQIWDITRPDEKRIAVYSSWDFPETTKCFDEIYELFLERL